MTDPSGDAGQDTSRKVGVFGGTFDPIHMGHLVVAEEVRWRLKLDEVLFIPAGMPWFKERQAVTSGAHRLAMVELAIASNPGFSACDVEVSRPGATYTVDTLEELRRRLGPDVGLYVVLGADALAEIDRWERPGRLFELAEVVGVARQGYNRPDLTRLEGLVPEAKSRVRLLEALLVDVSSTDVRHRVRKGRSIRYLVPESVERYIQEHVLYRCVEDGAP